MTKKMIYRISFVSAGEVYEIYAASVAQGGLFGFIEVEEILFGERSKLLIDSSEERLKTEFEGVQRTFIPLHSVLRIDEVEESRGAKIIPLPSGSSRPSSQPIPVPPPSDR